MPTEYFAVSYTHLISFAGKDTQLLASSPCKLFFLPGLFYGGLYLRIIGLGLFQKQLARAGGCLLYTSRCV